MEIRYTCNLCNNSTLKMIFKKEEIVGYLTCQCGGVMERVLRGPSVTIVETRDSGIMPRRVEQIQGIDEILDDRCKKDREDKGGQP